VTSFTGRLHPLSEVQAGEVLYPWTGAPETILTWGERVAEAPDALAATLALIATPNGKPAIALAPCWQGSLNEGEAAVSSLLTLGNPIMAKVQPMPPAALFSLFETNAVLGRCYAKQTRWLPSLTKGAVSALIAAAEGRTSARYQRSPCDLSKEFQRAKNPMGPRFAARQRQDRGGVGEGQPRGGCPACGLGSENVGGTRTLRVPGRLCQSPWAGRSRPTRQCVWRQSGKAPLDQAPCRSE
jgi:hypothetical protein